MTLERDLNHPPQTTDTNQMELWRFHALFDQPLKGAGDAQPQRSQAEQRALYDKSATLLHQVEDFAHADNTNTMTALSTPLVAAGARALFGSRAGWCVAGAMVGWSIYNEFKLDHQIQQIRAELKPDIQHDYKALSQASTALINGFTLRFDLGASAGAAALALASGRNGLMLGVGATYVGLAGFGRSWLAARDNINGAKVEVASAAEHLGIARPAAASLLTLTDVVNLDDRVTAQPTAKKTAAPEVPAGPAVGLHPNQPFTHNQPEGFSDYFKNIGK
jgi:hypothetical protein